MIGLNQVTYCDILLKDPYMHFLSTLTRWSFQVFSDYQLGDCIFFQGPGLEDNCSRCWDNVVSSYLIQ